MKKLYTVTVILVSLLFFLGGSVQASKDILISDSNEYGGKTWESTYEKGDEEYDIYKKVTAYRDSNKKLRKIEAFFTDKNAKKTGTYLKIRYLDPNGKPIKEEEFTTEEEIKRTDFEKSVTYFDSNGIKTKTENFCLDKLVKKDGTVKIITYYKDGKLDKTISEIIYSDKYAKENGYNREKEIIDIKKRIITSQYFMDDKLIKTEERKVP
jgi:hypothetical protein